MIGKLSADQQRFVQANLGLVGKVVCSFKRTTKHEYEELFQVGCLGLINAATRFDPSLGFRFSSYAIPYIKGEILHWMRDKSEVVRQHRDPSRRTKVISLDAYLLGDQDGITLLDRLAAPISETTEAQEQIQRAIACLEPIDQEILILRYFNSCQKEDIAEWIGKSTMTAARWMQDAKQRLKQAIEQNLEPSKAIGIERHNALPYRDRDSLHVPPFRFSCETCGRNFGRWHQPKEEIRFCSSKCSRDTKQSARRNRVRQLTFDRYAPY